MGDLVLTKDEIAPVMRSLVQDGLQVTAVHNHILRAYPATLYMRIAEMGEPVRLSQAIHGELGKSRTPMKAVAASDQALDLDVAELEAAFGQKGKAAGGTYQFSIQQADAVQDLGMPAPSVMRMAIAIKVQSAEDLFVESIGRPVIANAYS